jgi:diguanylate cyclase (GGDEF)-like protein
MQASEDMNDDFLFIDDSDEDDIFEESSGETWKILIVDDDPEIHSVTQLALSDLTVLDRRLEYLHAYSGQDACQLIESNEGIVLVLLDVVMETDDAGLNVVKYIRKDLAREDIRIVLRTGQPGYAPEESVIKDYDINDYKTKTELTRRKLVTTVYAAIRAYQQISAVNENRQGLENVISSAAELLELHTIKEYANGVLSQLNRLFGEDISGIFCAREPFLIERADELSFYILAQLGFVDLVLDNKISQLDSEQVETEVQRCYQEGKHHFSDNFSALYLSSGDYRAVIYLELTKELSSIDQQLIEVFLSNVAIGYENVHLFQKLRNAAYKDWLTELPNRLEFVNLLDNFLENETGNTVAALIDLNHFSDINDGLGQDVGNQLLSAVAKRLVKVAHQCQIARVGADVFGVIGPADLVNPESLLSIFIQPFEAGEQQLPINICIGLCRKENAGTSGVNILNQINIALNLAKKSADDHCIYYGQEMEDETLWRLGMLRQLRTDFSDNRLELWYQPQLNLATGKVIGAEALLRWRTAEGKFISPAVFIPLAEYSGLIIEIGDWVINQACLQVNKITLAGFSDVGISVNVSIPQFKRENFVDNVIQAIQIHQVDPKRIELEITENILIDDPQVVVDSLIKLKGQGIGIALDDFGTGYSSLSYLKKLPLDRLKVDRAFITDIAQDNQSILAKTIINLGQQMNLTVIAEGIEEIEQEECLKALGCDEVQGFFYAKPMPEDEFILFLEKNR